MNCVLPGLYISGISSLNPARLKGNGITHILSVFSGEVKQEDDKSYKRLYVDADDDDQQDLLQHFPKAISFIHDARISGGKCLVHCIAGISRSSTVVIAYVMTLTGWRWREAFASIKGNHQRAFPNLNFQNQLLSYEKRSSKDKDTEVFVENGRFQTRLYIKNIHSGTIYPWNSFAPKSVKRAVILGELRRADARSTTDETRIYSCYQTTGK